MAEFMPIRQRKIYSVRSGIKERNCKELLRFNSESVYFLAAQFLEESDNRRGGISRRQQMEIFLRFVGDPGFQSGVAQDATCNALEQFTSIRAQWPGSVHGGRVWRNSHVRDILSQYDGAVCLLGDSGYGLSPWLITPFKPARTNQEREFNLIHAREKVII
ncbi:hypothetical protein WA026_022745 [Henosepilachna vigintioctopunctata]|uniref:DDE Tnp4 domain-containing protein n=1 Tax=Henosepilachna vigintioctopunctata TaxID=420089 RepID=A0AAW1URW5_9CUCU